jgi:ubiquinone biosynthesis protein COQ9
MDKQQAAREIIAKALPMVPFDGWTQHTLNAAALAAGYKRGDAIRVFPEGAIQAANAYLHEANEQMLEALLPYHLDTMKIRERITLAVRLWLEVQTPNREALRKTLALHAQPFYLQHGLHALYETVDTIWYAIGDNSTDFNFYTKRATLAAVFSATLITWLNDHSSGHEQSWEFLDRRIGDVMQIEKAKAQLRCWLSGKLPF